MIAGRRAVMLSTRQNRALFAGFTRLAVASNPAMARLRKARYRGKNSGYRLPMQRRAYQALNCMGVRIWACKPLQFKGCKWRARRATVAAFVA
jgi:hypothetical protein